MMQNIRLCYLNPHLHIGLVDWREVYLLHPTISPLLPEVDRGRLVHRQKGSGRRISYAQIKKGLIKKTFQIKIEVPDWLFS